MSHRLADVVYNSMTMKMNRYVWLEEAEHKGAKTVETIQES